MSGHTRVAIGLLLVALAACATSAPPAIGVSSPKPVRPTCAREPTVACEGAPPTFEVDVQPILKRRCLGCHANGGVASEDHDFSTEAHVRAARRAIESRLAHCAMPPTGAPPIGDEEAETIRRWIACGQ